jgi:hypothetical protein
MGQRSLGFLGLGVIGLAIALGVGQRAIAPYNPSPVGENQISATTELACQGCSRSRYRGTGRRELLSSLPQGAIA